MKFQLNGSVIRLLLVTGAAFFVFFVLSTNQPSLQSSQFFFSNILNALIGATVVALVTSALFGYQAKIQADDEKKRVIYEKKLELYQRLARTFSELSKDNSTDSVGIGEALRPLLYEVVLLSSGSAGSKYLELIDAIGDLDDPEYILSISDQKNIMNFFVEARDDLDVMENISDRDKDALNAFLDSASDSSKIETRTMKIFRSMDEKEAIVSEYESKPAGEKRDWLKKTHNLTPADINRFKAQLKKIGKYPLKKGNSQ